MNATAVLRRRSLPAGLRLRIPRGTSRTSNRASSAEGSAVAPRSGSSAVRVPRRGLSRGEWGSLAALLIATLAFWLYGLTANGWANSFYSAAVQAGSQSWTAFFYGSSDAANSITVDKPPASLWLMALSVRLFGLSSAAILVPEVLLGVATVAVLYFSVRRHFGHAAGLIAGLVLAVTPVATLMFRFNNPDALLALFVTAACAATLRALESRSATWMVVAGVLIGFAFLTKTLQALLVLPVLAAVYLLAAPGGIGTRVRNGLLAVGAMVLSAGWWVAIVELVPASWRPYIGGSQNNSFLELTFGYNGVGRITGDEAGSVGPNMGTAGVLRMFSSSIGGQISWLIPAALVFLAVGLSITRRAARTDATRAAYLVWGGGLAITGVVFSLMAGIFHEYYTVALAPFIAALVGIGAVEATRRMRARGAGRRGSITLALVTAVTSVWSFVLLTRVGDAYGPLRYLVLAVGIAAALLLLVAGRLHRKALPLVLAAAAVAGLAGPTAFSVTTVSSGYSGSIVTAGPSTGGGMGRGGMGGGMGGPGGGQPPAAPGTTGQTGAQGMTPPGGTTPGGASQGNTTQGGTRTGDGGGGGMGRLLDASAPSTEVVAALTANADQYTWAAAAVGSQSAAGLQLGTGVPVMAVGGFNGSDPSPTLAQFQQYVENGQIHYFLEGGGFGGANGGSNASSEIDAWVQATFTPVVIGDMTFYDLTAPADATTTTTAATGTTTQEG